MLRIARELERFGDLVTNVAERLIFLVTGSMEEINVDDPTPDVAQNSDVEDTRQDDSSSVTCVSL